MAKARGKKAAKAADHEDAVQAGNLSPADPNKAPEDGRSPSTRARNAIEGAEYETSSGPDEVGATIGAVRPATEVLPNSRPAAAAVIVPTAEDEEYAKRRAKVLEQRKKESSEKPVSVLVVATRAGQYPAHGVLHRAGDQFMMDVPAGKTLEEFASWVEPVEEYKAARQEAQADAAAAAGAGAGAKKSGKGSKDVL